MNLHNLLACCIQKPSQVVFSMSSKTSHCCKIHLPAKQEPWAPNFEWNGSSKGSRPAGFFRFSMGKRHFTSKWPLRCQTICQCVEGRHQIRIQITIWESLQRKKLSFEGETCRKTGWKFNQKTSWNAKNSLGKWYFPSLPDSKKRGMGSYFRNSTFHHDSRDPKLPHSSWIRDWMYLDGFTLISLINIYHYHCVYYIIAYLD